MKNIAAQVAVTAIYLLALINPISKVSILAAFSPQKKFRTFMSLTTKSSLAALGILIGSMFFGDFLLRNIFHVNVYALQLAGGAVLIWVGFTALRKGVFFEQKTQDQFEDIALVPLACPMIAGPATIAACVAMPAELGLVVPVVSLVIALAVNDLFMRLSQPIAAVLTRFNILGALIRITGLFVMTIGTQMSLDGIFVWMMLNK
ncbi:MAG: MarC family protein [Phycisphaerae bacterium]|nr:MarC family protein [Phycisphaerae bacterium]